MTAYTTRLAIPYPQGSDPNNYPGQMQSMATALDPLVAVYGQGTLSARPSPSVQGRLYYATDNGNAYYDTGAAWVQLNLNAAASIAAKGDLLVGSGAGALSRLGVGTDGQSLTAASGATLGVQWQSILGMPLALSGAASATRFVGGTTSGAPASGTFAVGDFVIGQDGSISICTTAGSPGTWRTIPLSSAPRGVIARGRYTTSTSTTATSPSTAMKITELPATLVSGRLYRVYASDVPLTNTTDPANRIFLQITYTTDGSTPTVSGTRLTSSSGIGASTTNYAAQTISAFYAPGSNQTLKALLSVYGSAANTAIGGASDWPVELIIEDVGLDGGVTGTNF